MTQELIERLIGLHHRDGPPSIYGEAADALQSQSARIAELRDGLEDAASCLKEAGHTISRLEHGKIGERNFAYVAAEHAASLTKDSTSGGRDATA